VIFIQNGYYKGGVFKFVINIPEEYPDAAPSVRFLTDMFHPLINTSGNCAILHKFPRWRPHQGS
jgi:ubiquitin-protein ligase